MELRSCQQPVQQSAGLQGHQPVIHQQGFRLSQCHHPAAVNLSFGTVGVWFVAYKPALFIYMGRLVVIEEGAKRSIAAS